MKGISLDTGKLAHRSQNSKHFENFSATRRYVLTSAHNEHSVTPTNRRNLLGLSLLLLTSVNSPSLGANASEREENAAPPTPQATPSNSTVLDSPPLPGENTIGTYSSSSSQVPLASDADLAAAAEQKLQAEEEERKKAAKPTRRGRIRELQDIRSELAEKELVLLQKEQELLDKDQTLMVLREELEIEKKLRALLTKEREKAEEEAALAMGICGGGSMLP
jgi:hypothetical protein